MPIGESHPTVLRYKQLLEQLGHVGLNALFPNDFEAYICSLELVDSQGVIMDFFVFPVMPSGITETNSTLTNIKKTAGGITILKTDTFVPVDISLQGDFGRRLKILIGRNLIDARAVILSTSGGVYNKESLKQGAVQLTKAVFDSSIKTGYGCIKILQSIYDRAQAVDKLGNPYKLFFYNMALGSSYLVEPMNLTLSQTYDSNMIWKYNLQLKGVAPVDTTINLSSLTRKSLTSSMQYGALSKIATLTAGTLQSELKNLPSYLLSKKTKKGDRGLSNTGQIIKNRL